MGVQLVIPSELEQLSPYPYLNPRAEQTISRIRSTTGIVCEKSLKRRLEEQGFYFNDDVDNKSVYDPNALFTQLQQYLIRDKEPNFQTDAWNAAYRVTQKAFSLEKVRPLEDDASRILAMKGEKSGGAPFFEHKEDTWYKDVILMHKWCAFKMPPEPCVAQHRVQHGEEGPKVRLVWAYPQMVTLAEATFARPLIDAYIRRNCPMAFGKQRFRVAARIMHYQNKHAQYGLDMRKFDASCSRKLINMAFQILRRNLDLNSEEEEKMWNRVKHYFINTPILMPDGRVYTKHHGVPSGSYFTQLVDSIINFFIVQYTWYTITGKCVNPNYIMVLGDDSLFATSELVSMREIARVLKSIGFDVHDDEKSFLTVDGKEFQHFLGHTFVNGIVDRPKEEIAKRMIYPERHDDKEQDARKRILQRIYQYAADGLSAHELILALSRIRSNNVVEYYENAVILDKHDMGWFESQRSVGIQEDEGLNAWEQAVVSILK